MERWQYQKKKKKLFTPCRAFVGKRAKPILHCGLIKDAPASTVPTTALSHVLTALWMCFWSWLGDVLHRWGEGLKRRLSWKLTHIKCEFLKCEKKSRRLTGSWWRRGTRTWQGQESPTTVGGGLRTVLGEFCPRLEGLPVDGTCSVFFIFPLWHPHLLKGVQWRQDGAAAERTVGSNHTFLHIFCSNKPGQMNSYPIHVE